MTRSEEITVRELREINQKLSAIADALKEIAKAQKKPATTAAKKTTETGK